VKLYLLVYRPTNNTLSLLLVIENNKKLKLILIHLLNKKRIKINKLYSYLLVIKNNKNKYCFTLFKAHLGPDLGIFTSEKNN